MNINLYYLSLNIKSVHNCMSKKRTINKSNLSIYVVKLILIVTFQLLSQQNLDKVAKFPINNMINRSEFLF